LITNEKLETLYWDHNGTTLAGLQSFLNGLKKNGKIKAMPLPINDISSALKLVDNPKTAQDLNECCAKIQEILFRNQGPGSAKLGGGQTFDLAPNTGSTFAFLSSGLREEMVQTLQKIKSTGRKIESPEDLLILDDAEMQDQMMTGIYSLKDAFGIRIEHELKAEIARFTKDAYPLYGKLKNQFIGEIIDSISARVKCIPKDTLDRLRRNLGYGGGKDLSQEDFEKVLIDNATKELSALSLQAFHSTASIASDYIYEKMQVLLQGVYEGINQELKQEEAKKAGIVLESTTTPVVTKTPAAAPEKKKAPKEPSKGKISTKKEDKKDEINVEVLPKVESNLSHLTKDRPANAGRRPPTRKARA